MPDPNDYEDEDKWMAACVPTRIEEGDDQDQAVAVCMSMWKKHQEGKALDFKLDNELKVGARHSQRDQRALQDIHDAAITLGAACPPAPSDEIVTFPLGNYDKTLVALGRGVKALGEAPEGVHVDRKSTRLNSSHT